jgi:two-component system, NtrC family, nitrogen regulation response regulator NtrX
MAGPAPRVLIVDDEPNIRRTVALILEGEGYETASAAGYAEAVKVLGRERVSAVLLDVRLGDGDGIDLLRRIKAGDFGAEPGTPSFVPVIMISGHASLMDAARATQIGAFDFLEKPPDRDRILVSVRNAIEVSALRAALANKVEMIGESPVMQELKRQIAKVAPTRGRVLITGESGTGKDLVARAVHEQSSVATGPFVKVNCAAIPPELIESELFGHERGAFTGAVGQKRGLFEVADGGTIFLDEIGDMSQSAQAKVLRVLQTGELSRVGGEKTIKVDCRVIAATNKELEQEVTAGRFREDLYFRLNVIPIRCPALRERAVDVPALARAFAQQCCDENGFPSKPFRAEVVEHLCAYSWPGNVRELKNVVERLVILSDDEITERDLPPGFGGVPVKAGDPPSAPVPFTGHRFAAQTLREFRDEAEREFIRQKLREFDWNISRTAQALGIERTNLHKKLRALGIERDP